MQTPSREPSLLTVPVTVEPPIPKNAAGLRPKRRYRLTPEGRKSPQALAARRANLKKARAAPKEVIYRATARRQAASRANIQEAIAWRRSPQGNASARLNAFKHGLAAKTLPELLARLGEAPEDFEKHHELVRQVFRPKGTEERYLVERLARATWRRIRIFRAQARYERSGWRSLLPRAGRARHITLEEFSDRACQVSKLLMQARLVEDEAYKLEDRIERILAALIRERASRKGFGTRGSGLGSRG